MPRTYQPIPKLPYVIQAYFSFLPFFSKFWPNKCTFLVKILVRLWIHLRLRAVCGNPPLTMLTSAASQIICEVFFRFLSSLWSNLPQEKKTTGRSTDRVGSSWLIDTVNLLARGGGYGWANPFGAPLHTEAPLTCSACARLYTWPSDAHFSFHSRFSQEAPQLFFQNWIKGMLDNNTSSTTNEEKGAVCTLWHFVQEMSHL